MDNSNWCVQVCWTPIKLLWMKETFWRTSSADFCLSKVDLYTYNTYATDRSAEEPFCSGDHMKNPGAEQPLGMLHHIG